MGMGAFLQYDNDPAVAPTLHDGSNQFNSAKKYIFSIILENTPFQVDASILITANVPSAKKIIIHGPQEPDDGVIPSQFPISEDIQFCQLQQEATDFFGIEETKMDQFYLVDHKTSESDTALSLFLLLDVREMYPPNLCAGKIHNPFHFVRDFYFFKRSQYPQLSLVHKRPAEAAEEMQVSEHGCCYSDDIGQPGQHPLFYFTRDGDNIFNFFVLLTNACI